MAAEPLPLPPELAVTDEPFHVEQLHELLQMAAEYARDAAIDFDAALGDYQDEPPDGRVAPVARWQAADDGGAEWAARHLVRATAELAGLQAQAQEWLRQIADWAERVMRPAQREVVFFQGHLERYALGQRDHGRMTIELPSATLTTRATPAKADVDDAGLLVKWARENLEAAEVAEVVHQPDPEIRLRGLAGVARVVEVVDEWRATLTCACVVPIAGMPSLEPGTGTVCPSCGAEALVGRLEVAQAHHEVQDKAGRVVAGARVRPAKVTPKVVPHA